ncbi:MAG TPA: hypothetical protein VLY63_12960, partial [Anaerolineae bacterium]|nr:hypothetical protein [Anaerolineae bacterium]
MGRWIGLGTVAGLLGLCLVLVGGQVSAEQEAPPEWPPWKLEAVFGAGDGGDMHPLSPSEQGAWDGFRVEWPCVISETLGYGMLYSGGNPSSPGYGWQIGGAGSPDGTTWTKYPGNPLLGVGAP